MAMSVGDEGPSSSSRGNVSEGRVAHVDDGGGGEHEDAQTPTQTQAQPLEPTSVPFSSTSSTTAAQESETGVSWMNVWPFNTWNSKEEQNANKRQYGTNPAVVPKTEKKDKQTMIDPHLDVQPVAGPSSMAIRDAPAESAGTNLARSPGRPSPTPSVFETSPQNPTTRQRPKFRVQGQRRWVPSTTKLSFEALWWGYRMFVNHFLRYRSNSNHFPQIPPPTRSLRSL
jgi:hypothetical protein